MPPKIYKRSYNKRYRKYGGKPKASAAATTLQAVVRRTLTKQLNKKLETKRGCQTQTDGVEIFHNNFATLNSTMLSTTQGVQDPILSSTDNRIGDEITLKGVSVKMMVELNERYSDVSFRLLIVKCAKGDAPTRGSLYTGLSGNKMIDTLNTERYTVIHQKFFKIKAPNKGTSAGMGASGTAGATDANSLLSRATRVVKVWIPGSKFVRSGIIKYEQQSSQPKFFDYHCLLYAYSNWSTLQDVYYVARVNDYVQQIYYKDA
jgi:hypothetical protein